MKPNLYFILICLALIVLGHGCGQETQAKEHYCTVNKVEGKTLIHCPDGSSASVRDGVQGFNGADGLDGSQGPQGITGANGTNGTNGADGAQGPQGEAGHDGLNGTLITVVPLCPGATTYPSVFVEVAFCIDNKLYAVYSKNNGFMTYLPAGMYKSNAVGSRCNFIVACNCQIN